MPKRPSVFLKKIKRKQTVNVNFFNSFGQIPTQLLTQFMNKKTKFFKNVLLLQFIPVFLLGVFILSNPKSQKVIRIREIHPYEFNYGYAVPLFVFGIGLVLALFSLFSKQEDVLVDESEILKIKRRQNFWKFAFYCNVFTLLFIAVVSVGVFRQDSFVIDQPVLFYSLIFLRCLVVLLLSLVVASFFLASGIYWKSNKTLASIILIFGFFIIIVAFVFDVVFIRQFMSNSENYVRHKNEKRVLVNEGEDSEEYSESEDSYEGEYGEQGKESNYKESEENQESDYESSEEVKKLQALVLDKSTVVDSWNAMRDDFFVKKIGNSFDLVGLRMYVYSVLAGQTYDNDYRVINFISDLKDRPVRLYDGLQSYKWILFSTVSKETYRSNQFDQVVDALLFTYHDVGEDAGKLDLIYEIMQNNIDSDENNIGKFLPEIKKVCSPYVIKELKKNKGFYKSNSDIVWFYSFWARRNKEGNKDVVYKVLREIRVHYI